MPPSPPRLICFDLGGVLVRIARSWAEGCALAGLDVRTPESAADWTIRRKPISEAYQLGRISTDEFLTGLSESMNGLYSPAEVKRIHDAWTIAEYPGVDRVIDRLVSNPSITTGILSNTNDLHWRRLDPDSSVAKPEYPSLPRLRHRHASHILGLAKPGEEIYREFERRTEHRGNEILFFDDLEENVLTARRVGWQAEVIDHTGDTAAQIESHLKAHNLA